MDASMFNIIERNLYKLFRDYGIKDTAWYHMGTPSVSYSTGVQTVPLTKYSLPRVIFSGSATGKIGMSTGFFEHLNFGNMVTFYDATLIAYVKDILAVGENDYFVKDHIKYNLVSCTPYANKFYHIKLKALPSEVPREIYDLTLDSKINTSSEVTSE
jgi:hypothetical protein